NLKGKKTHLHSTRLVLEVLQSSINRNFCSHKEFQSSIQVCILGAYTPLGRSTSFLLKQNPLFSVLKIHGEQNVKNLAVDLNFIDTRCKVQPYEGIKEIPRAIRSADIVVILGKDELPEDASLVDRVTDEGKRIYDIARECITYAPRAILLVCAKPVSVTTEIVERVFKESYWYHPGRIVGSAALAQVKANTLLGRFQDLNPRHCNVPLVGGPDVDLAVPLFNGYVRCNLLEACRHLVTTVRFSRGGIVDNCGIPHMSKLELELLEKVALEIQRRERMAKGFIESIEDGKSQPFNMREMEKKAKIDQKAKL
ncbi:hypothetical protein NQ317_012556, partial [Molorchus minor]